jgi:hypothetical protein
VVQWGAPNTNVANAAFGSITETRANDPRPYTCGSA